IRADLLHRYPNTVVYAAEARWVGAQRAVSSTMLVPSMAATLGTDVAMFGFDLTAADARGSDAPPGAPGWYFVLAEHPSEPRFGLGASAVQDPTAWNDVAWSDLQAADWSGSYLGTKGSLAARQFPNDPRRWGVDAAATAAITRRRAIR